MPSRPSISVARLLDALGFDTLPARELASRLGVAQPTVSRLIGRAGERVLRVGKGRSTRYARVREVFGAGYAQPLFSISPSGVAEHVATLRAFAEGAYLVDEASAPWLRGEAGTGVFESLPYFLYDLRPAGFLGRQTARRLAPALSAPRDPRDWSDEHIGRYFLGWGHDLPGNLVVGERAIEAALSQEPEPVEDRAASYPAFARASLRDEAPGSSAAGEQPKFAIYHAEAGHMIVKFSPAGEGPEAERWRDLLRAEHHALAVLREAGLPAAPSELFAFDGRVFLETRRFDRHGARGRSPAISLAMIDAEFAGVGLGWGAVGAALLAADHIAAETASQLAWAETYGHWIGNSDMHLGNISLAPRADEALRFELLPLYDMLPMAFAPLRGELPTPKLLLPIRRQDDLWESARAAAERTWQRLADDAAISSDFRRLADDETRRVRQRAHL